MQNLFFLSFLNQHAMNHSCPSWWFWEKVIEPVLWMRDLEDLWTIRPIMKWHIWKNVSLPERLFWHTAITLTKYIEMCFSRFWSATLASWTRREKWLKWERPCSLPCNLTIEPLDELWARKLLLHAWRARLLLHTLKCNWASTYSC